MEMQFVIVTVKDGKALSAGKPCDYSTAKTFAEDGNKKYKKDGINHIIFRRTAKSSSISHCIKKQP